jgi:hypothetical protein
MPYARCAQTSGYGVAQLGTFPPDTFEREKPAKIGAFLPILEVLRA